MSNLSCEVICCVHNDNNNCCYEDIEIGYHPGLPGKIDGLPAILCFTYENEDDPTDNSEA